MRKAGMATWAGRFSGSKHSGSCMKASMQNDTTVALYTLGTKPFTTFNTTITFTT